jgi:cell division protein ZapA (FtsZ GTPase activity inhibitor)
MSKPIEIVMNDELEKLLAAATPGPWTHASDKLAAGNIKAPDNAALIVAAVNALPELLAENERLREESAANRRLLRLYAIQHGTVTET